MEAHMLTSEWLLAQDTPIHRAKGALTVGCKIQWIGHWYTEEEKPFPMGGAVSYAVISYKKPWGTGKKAKRISIRKKKQENNKEGETEGKKGKGKVPQEEGLIHTSQWRSTSSPEVCVASPHS